MLKSLNTPRCAACRHWAPDAGHVEQSIAGLNAFSSAYGASIGDSRLCRRHDCLVSPRDKCWEYASDAGAKETEAVA